MPSATAMFDSLLPASAGTPGAAPGVQDAATAGLFSSKLSEVLQAANAVAAPNAEAPAEPAALPVGRLSLPSLTLAAEVETAEAVTPPAIPVEVAAETPGFIDRPTPTPSETTSEDTSEAALDTTVPAASFLAPAPQSGLLVELDTTTTDAVAQDDTPAPSQPTPQAATVPTASPQDIRAASSPAVEAAASSEQPRPEPSIADVEMETASTAPVPVSVESETVQDRDTLPLQTAAVTPRTDATLAAPAPNVAPTPTAFIVQPAQAQVAQTAQIQSVAVEPASPQTVEAEQIAAAIKAAAPMAQGEVKVTTQPAVARQTASTAAAVAVQLAAAEASEPTETDALTGETADASDTPPQSTPPAMSQTAGAAPARTVAPSQPAPQQQASANVAPAEVAVTPTGEQAAPTAHVSMAEAGAAQASATPAPDAPVVAAIDVAAAPTDPSAPLEITVENRPLENAATTAQTAAQTAASGLSRATIETTAHLAAQIARKLEGRSTRFDMVLTPEDLGRVDVSLEIGSDGQLAARLAFDNPAAAADLRGRADELRRQLQEAGFQIAQDSLDFTQRDASSGGSFGDRQQQRQSLFAGGSRLAAQADLPPAPPPGAWTNHSQTRDRVDVRV